MMGPVIVIVILVAARAGSCSRVPARRRQRVARGDAGRRRGRRRDHHRRRPARDRAGGRRGRAPDRDRARRRRHARPPGGRGRRARTMLRTNDPNDDRPEPQLTCSLLGFAPLASDADRSSCSRPSPASRCSAFPARRSTGRSARASTSRAASRSCSRRKPPKGQQLTSPMMDDSVSIMRNRVDKLGVSEPRDHASRAPNQIVIELPAVHDPTQAAQIIGQTAQLELYDLTPSLLRRRRSTRRRTRSPHTSLFDLLTRVQTGQKGAPSAYYLFNSRDEEARRRARADASPRSSATRSCIALKPSEAEDRHRQDEGDQGQEGEDDDARRQAGQDDRRLPDRLPGADRRRTGTVVITCDSTTAVVCPGLHERTRRRASPTTTSSSTASTRSTRRARSRR